MTDSQIQALAAQIQANTVKIEGESSARVVAGDLLARRIGSLESLVSGDMQSANYVPGVSGWKLNTLTGEFEINSARPHSGVEAQMITVTAGEWPDNELPSNAIERYRFIGDQVMNIPDEYRDSAEFSTEDFSVDRDGSDYRTTLTYVRQETQEELSDRLERAKVAGTRINLVGGVLSITHDGKPRACIRDLQKDEQPQPFVVIDGAIYINHAIVDDAKTSQLLVSADRFALKHPENADQLIDALSGSIGVTRLAKSLKADIDQMKLDLLAEQAQADADRPLLTEKLKDIIRAELMPGGLLHRSR